MSQGRSIRLFLVDGTPNGLLIAEIMNRTGHALTGPHTRLSDLTDEKETTSKALKVPDGHESWSRWPESGCCEL